MDDWKKLERVRGSAVPLGAPLTPSQAFRVWLAEIEARVQAGWLIRLVGRALLRAWFDEGRTTGSAGDELVALKRASRAFMDAPLV